MTILIDTSLASCYQWNMDAGADWEVVHGEICSLGRKRAEHEHALGRALLRAQRTRVWEALGMATLYEYAERFVGLRP
jgi:hypothetical protein